MTDLYYILAALLFVLLKNMWDKHMAKKRYNAYKITYSCHAYFNHEHRFEFTSQICRMIQWLFVVNKLHAWGMKTFNPKKYNKIILCLSRGGGKRAMKRRMLRGKEAV